MSEIKRKFLDESIIKLEHYQELGKEHRGNYVKGLALDCYLHPQSDRNAHYLGRDLLWSGRLKSAVQQFQRHLDLNSWWQAERSQSLIHMADALMRLGDEEKALAALHRAYDLEPTRREPFIALAEHYWRKGNSNDGELRVACAQRTAAYCAAAMQIPQNAFYANDTANYTWWPHEMMYWACWNLKKWQEARHHFDECVRYLPHKEKYQADRRFFYDKPMPVPFVSIIIPTLGRPEKLKRCLQAIKENAEYDQYEVIVIHDGEPVQDPNFYPTDVIVAQNPERLGVPKTVKKAVEMARGELVMFLGNDCVPDKAFLRNAVQKMYQETGQIFHGLVGLNDGVWDGRIASHWLASKKLLPLLDGELFHTGYNHVGCDNELTERVRKMGLYWYAEDAKLMHDHPIHKGMKEEDMDEVYKLAYSKTKEDRALLAERAKLFDFAVT